MTRHLATLRESYFPPAVYPRLIEFLHFDIQGSGKRAGLSAVLTQMEFLHFDIPSAPSFPQFMCEKGSEWVFQASGGEAAGAADSASVPLGIRKPA